MEPMKPTLRQKAATVLLFRTLAPLRFGCLTITLPDGKSRTFGDTAVEPVLFRVTDWSLPVRLAGAGLSHLGETYAEGLWETDNLPIFLRILLANDTLLSEGWFALPPLRRKTAPAREALRRLWGRRQPPPPPPFPLLDAPLEFLQSYADPGLSGQAGVFSEPGGTLEQGVQRKLSLLMEKARVRPESRLLDAGAGSFAFEALRWAPCRATVLALSDEQEGWILSQAASSGLSERVAVERGPLSSLPGPFERVALTGPLAGWSDPRLLAREVSRLLAPRGIALLEIPVIPEPRFARSAPWLLEGAVPSGPYPTFREVVEALARRGLLVEEMVNLGPHLARTFSEWRQRLTANRERVRALGYGDDDVRRHLFTFARSEALFASRRLSDLLMVVSRAGNPELPPPPTRRL